MANKRKIGAVIALDGEKQFRTAVSKCSKALSTMKSELKLVQAQTAGSADSVESLEKKHDVLSRTLETSVKKEEALKSALQNAEQQYAKVGAELDDYKQQLSAAEKALADMETSGTATTEELEKQRSVVESLSGTVEKGERAYKTAGDRVQNWKRQLNDAGTYTAQLNNTLAKNDAQLEEAKTGYKDAGKSVEEYGGKAKDAANETKNFADALELAAATKAINFVTESLKSAVTESLSLADATAKLQASTGATAEEMKNYSAAMSEVYTSGYGESMTDVANAMAMIRQYTGEIDSDNLQEMAESAMTLEDTFGMDLSESIRGVSALMTNFGLDAEEAFDYIATGAQMKKKI